MHEIAINPEQTRVLQLIDNVLKILTTKSMSGG